MGAWAEDAFGNDIACDWAGDFAENPSFEIIDAVIERVLEADYIESDDASECVVACEILARLKGNWGRRSTYSESIDVWVESSKVTPPEYLINNAKIAITKILGENSELQELWDEDGKNEKWHQEMNDLLVRVGG